MTISGKRIGPGSHVRVVAPARSLSLISDERVDIATARFKDLSIDVSLGKHVRESDEFASSSVAARVSDLHDAFADPTVDAIYTVIGGYNSVHLLGALDYDLIARNPKILCGYSDITTLSNAIYAKTGLVGYSGPHFSTFSMLKGLEYTVEYFKKCFFTTESYEVLPAPQWSDDEWFMDQSNRNFIDNDGYWVINAIEGVFTGTSIGGNLGCFAVLQGTPFMPMLKGSVLFVEEDSEVDVRRFDRQLQSIIYQDGFDQVEAILIGRFQKRNHVTREALTRIIKSKPELAGIPVIANCDFGHTTPIFSYPIGGQVTVSINSGLARVVVDRH